MDPHIRRCIFDAVAWLAGVVMAVVLAVDAMASERQAINPANDNCLSGECRSCHVAHPSRLLDATSWRTIMQCSCRASEEPA
jgi:hypothetical protein